MMHQEPRSTNSPTRPATPRGSTAKILNPFGSMDYAREELVAEMGSAFLCATLGIVPTVRHADYLASWLEVLREDNKAIFRAASGASKAADWLLARHGEAEDQKAMAGAAQSVCADAAACLSTPHDLRRAA